MLTSNVVLLWLWIYPIYSSLRCPLSIRMQNSILAGPMSSLSTSITLMSLTQPSVRSWGSMYVELLVFAIKTLHFLFRMMRLLTKSTTVHFTQLHNDNNNLLLHCSTVWPTFEALSILIELLIMASDITTKCLACSLSALHTANCLRYWAAQSKLCPHLGLHGIFPEASPTGSKHYSQQIILINHAVLNLSPEQQRASAKPLTVPRCMCASTCQVC